MPIERLAMNGDNICALFAYGLLQPGERIYDILSPYVAELIKNTCVHGYCIYAASFPMATTGQSGDRVWGTLIILKEAAAIIPQIDEIESAYDRIMVDVHISDNTVKACMYVYRGKPFGELVEDGDFIAWRERRRGKSYGE